MMDFSQRMAVLLLQARQRLASSLRASGLLAEDLEIAVEPPQSLYGDPAEISLGDFGAQAGQVIDVPEGPVVGLSPRAVQAAMAHTAANAQVESGGLCLGNVFLEQGTGRLLLQLMETIPASVDPQAPALSGPAHLTFTPETWQQLVNAYLQNYPELRILGWYHSHPGMDVFLSSMDLFIQNHFFTASWQLAMVLDPLRQRVGVFTRQGEQRLTPTVLDWAEQAAPTLEQPVNETPHSL